MRWVPLFALWVLVSTPACSLLTSDFTANVDFTAVIEDEDPFYNDFELFDPNDNEDFRDNKERIEDGKITRITITILTTEREGLDHAATLGVGQIDIRGAPEDAETPPAEGFDPTDLDSIPGEPFIQAVARWNNPVALVGGESFDLDLNEDTLDEVHGLIFERAGPLEVRFLGLADTGPVNFEFEVEFELDFRANVL
jgi:hypothetical protein